MGSQLSRESKVAVQALGFMCAQLENQALLERFSVGSGVRLSEDHDSQVCGAVVNGQEREGHGTVGAAVCDVTHVTEEARMEGLPGLADVERPASLTEHGADNIACCASGRLGDVILFEGSLDVVCAEGGLSCSPLLVSTFPLWRAGWWELAGPQGISDALASSVAGHLS